MRGRECCPARGTLVDPARPCAVAAEFTLAGRAPLPDREALEQSTGAPTRRLAAGSRSWLDGMPDWRAGRRREAGATSASATRSRCSLTRRGRGSTSARGRRWRRRDGGPGRRPGPRHGALGAVRDGTPRSLLVALDRLVAAAAGRTRGPRGPGRHAARRSPHGCSATGARVGRRRPRARADDPSYSLAELAGRLAARRACRRRRGARAWPAHRGTCAGTARRHRRTRRRPDPSCRGRDGTLYFPQVKSSSDQLRLAGRQPSTAVGCSG